MLIKRYNNGSKAMDNSVVESLIKEGQEELETMNLQSCASSLIKQIWDMIDAINGNLILSQEINNTDFEVVLNDILTDCYTGIGQLEQFVQDIAPEAEAIEDGKTEEEVVDVADEETTDELLDDGTPSDLLQ